MTLSKAQKALRQTQRDDAIKQLREMLPPGSTVRTILRHVARSGMTRWISPVVNDRDISWPVARALDEPYGIVPAGHEGIKIGGCGMDMGSQLVYSLSRTLYPDGFECLGERQGPGWSLCPSNDHSNGDRDYTPHNHEDGGYALNHRWL